jgi:plasmid segregation protein ParM
MSIVIAIDHGNSAVKTVSHQFVSGLSEHLVRPPLAEDLIEYEGKYWTLSSNRIAYKRDKTQDERFFILTLFAIAKELNSRGELAPLHSVVLATGLPPEHYGQGRESFAAYFKHPGIIKFVYNDTPLSVMVEKVYGSLESKQDFFVQEIIRQTKDFGRDEMNMAMQLFLSVLQVVEDYHKK